MNKILGKLFLILGLLIPAICLSAVDILVSTDRNPVHMDESFQLVFEANGGVDEEPDFSPLKVLLDVVRQSENSSISIINGSMTRSKKWVLTVMPKHIGNVQIPSIFFGDDKSEPFVIKVVKANQAQMGDSSFYVTLSSDVASSIEQAQIIVTIRVFSDKSLSEISLASLQFNHGDVVVETLGDEKSFQTKIQGKAYLVIEQKMALFPLKPGPLIVQPVLALAEVRVGTRTFFGDPASKPVRARSDSLKINVDAKPQSTLTWLPAKSLVLKDEWLSDPSNFTVGEPITRVLTITAVGLTAAHLPELNVQKLDSVKMYPDQELLKNTVTALGVIGIRQEKIAYIPFKPGIIKLPKKSISWWNTVTEQWETTEVAEQIITVKPSDSFVEQAPVMTQLAKEAIEKKTPDTVMEQVDEETTFLYKPNEWWKWLSMVFALAWLITLFLYFNKGKASLKKTPIKIKSEAKFNMTVLKLACQSMDSIACKEAMIEWANARYSDSEFIQLAELKAKVSADLRLKVEELEKTLYASDSNRSWDADSLYQQVIIENKTTAVQFNKESKSLKSLHLS